MDKLPRVTEILRGVGLIDFSNVPDYIMAPAQKFGTAVHKATELWDKGTLDIEVLDPNLIPWLDSWKKFLSDYKIVDIDKTLIEKSYISEKWGFRGTPDRVFKIGKKNILVDIKSSTTMQPATKVQTAAYQLLVEESGVKIHERWGIQLTGERRYKVTPYKSITDRSVFISALTLWKFKQANNIK